MGACSGAVVGTAGVPVLGTAVGGVIGAFIGAGFGLFSGLALIVLAPRGASTAQTCVVAGTSSALAGAALTGAFAGFGTWSAVVSVLISAAGCALIGTAVGPAVAYGLEPREPRSGPGAFVTGAKYGLLGGLCIGGMIGLVVGLFAYPPTAPFAALELGVPGGLIGLLLGLAAGASWLLLTSRVRR